MQLLCIATINQQYVVENHVFHAKTKHVTVCYQFIRKKVLHDEIESKHIKTKYQVVDLYTKCLNGSKFGNFHCQLSVISRVEASVEGEC